MNRTDEFLIAMFTAFTAAGLLFVMWHSKSGLAMLTIAFISLAAYGARRLHKHEADKLGKSPTDKPVWKITSSRPDNKPLPTKDDGMTRVIKLLLLIVLLFVAFWILASCVPGILLLASLGG